MVKLFKHILANTLIANVTTSYLWFALVFWSYLQTESVLATSILGGSFMLAIAITSLFFGTIVDRHKKKNVMLASSFITLAAFFIAGIVYLSFTHEQLTNWNGVVFWLFTGVILIGAVVESMRNIALSTTVTLLVPKDGRDKANGLVGAVQGVAFMITSVFSGLSIGYLGLGWTLVIATLLTAVSAVHLLPIKIPEKEIYHDPELAGKRIDIKGSLTTIREIPGLMALLFFNTFNNFLGGVFMALLDPYGLTLFSVQMWGLVFGITSIGFIAGGLIISKRGLGRNPLRTLLMANLIISVIGFSMALREWWLLLVVCLFAYMAVFPAAEAAEQTVIQKVVPFKRQGRVFGFAQSIEAAASPITAFVIGPIAQYSVIPYMKTTEGHAAFGWLLGNGSARGIALIFVGASLIMAVVTLLAFRSRSYRSLSNAYEKS